MPDKRALCIGIDNYPGPEALNGCANDARRWRDVLVRQHGFADDRVELLLDNAATGARLRERIAALFAGAGAGDVRVLTVSCHGSSVPAADGSGMVEVLCPVDVERGWLALVDIAAVTHGLPSGAAAFVVLDACFHATVTRAALAESLPGEEPTSDVRVRYLAPALLGRKPPPRPAVPAGPVRWNALVLLASGTQPEMAYEGYVKGAYTGVLSHYACEALRTLPAGASYDDWLAAIRPAFLPSASYPQSPRLVGSASARRRPVFC